MNRAVASRSRTGLPNTGLRAVDRALAQALQRLDPSTDARVLDAAELASLAVGLGHAAVDLSRPVLLGD